MMAKAKLFQQDLFKVFSHVLNGLLLAAWLLGGPAFAANAEIPEIKDDLEIHFESLEKSALEILSHPISRTDAEAEAELNSLRDKLASVRDRATRLASDGTLQSRILRAEIDKIEKVFVPAWSRTGAEEKIGTDLAARKERLLAPIIRWNLISARSGALVTEVDNRIVELRTKRAFRLQASPISPALWAEAISEIGLAGGAAISGARRSPASSVLLGFMGLLLVSAIAAFYLFPDAKLVTDIKTRFADIRSHIQPFYPIETLRQKFLFGFICVIGIFLFAMFYASLSDERLQLVIRIFGLAVILPLVANWLARAMLTARLRTQAMGDVDHSHDQRIVRIITVLSLFVVCAEILRALEERVVAGQAFVSLMSGLFLIVAGILLWALSNKLKLRQAAASSEGDPTQGQDGGRNGDVQSDRILTAIVTILRLIAVVAVISAFSGYLTFARGVLERLLGSFFIIAIAAHIYATVRRLLGVDQHDPEAESSFGARDSISLLIGLAITIMLIFLLALVWGYRVREAADFVSLLQVGVTIDGVQISAGDVLKFLVTFGVALLAIRWVQKLLRHSILPGLVPDVGLRSAILAAISYVGFVMAALLAILSTDLDLTSFSYIAGALSLGIGFGLRSLVENFSSGLILLFERSIKVGDWIEVDGYSGIVKKIAVRATLIETFDRQSVMIPNSLMFGNSVTNYALGNRLGRLIVNVGVKYDTDMELAKNVLLKIAHDDKAILSRPAPKILNTELGESSVVLSLVVFVADVYISLDKRSQLRFQILEKFSAAGIEIPFPQRDIHIINDGTKVASPSL